MTDSYMTWTEWWMDLWTEYPLLFVVVVGAGIALTLFNNKMRRRK